jgi:hypothetical protein
MFVFFYLTYAPSDKYIHLLSASYLMLNIYTELSITKTGTGIGVDN